MPHLLGTLTLPSRGILMRGLVERVLRNVCTMDYTDGRSCSGVLWASSLWKMRPVTQRGTRLSVWTSMLERYCHIDGITYYDSRYERMAISWPLVEITRNGPSETKPVEIEGNQGSHSWQIRPFFLTRYHARMST